MGTFIQLVVDGLSTGSIYAALALAIVLVNQATGLINFAQGGMAVAQLRDHQRPAHGVGGEAGDGEAEGEEEAEEHRLWGLGIGD